MTEKSQYRLVFGHRLLLALSLLVSLLASQFAPPVSAEHSTGVASLGDELQKADDREFKGLDLGDDQPALPAGAADPAGRASLDEAVSPHHVMVAGLIRLTPAIRAPPRFLL